MDGHPCGHKCISPCASILANYDHCLSDCRSIAKSAQPANSSVGLNSYACCFAHVTCPTEAQTGLEGCRRGPKSTFRDTISPQAKNHCMEEA